MDLKKQVEDLQLVIIADMPKRTLKFHAYECHKNIRALCDENDDLRKEYDQLKAKLEAAEKVIDCGKELIDLEESRLRGEYEYDSFTLQPLRLALANYKEKDGE